MTRLAALSITLGLAVPAAAAAQEPVAVPAPVEAEVAAPERVADGGVAPPGDEAEPPPSGDGEAGDGKGDGGKAKGDGGKGNGDGKRRPKKLRLLRADARPSVSWFRGRPAIFRFAIDGRRRRNVVVQVKRKGRHPAIVRRYVVKNVRPRRAYSVRWYGRTDNKRFARQGTYKFKVRARHGAAADARGAAGSPRAGFYKHKFPVRGRHTYGDGLGAGRGHRGLDVFAPCGTALQAARAGRVQHEGYQRQGAGHYLVIDGKGTGKDYVYMHLQRASRLGTGDRVGTGERIGRVGESGNASGCHLHFELWSGPGWYEGGDFLDPVPRMRAWDRWS